MKVKFSASVGRGLCAPLLILTLDRYPHALEKAEESVKLVTSEVIFVVAVMSVFKMSYPCEGRRITAI